MKNKPVSLLFKKTMLKLTTSRLLAYKKKLMKYHESSNWDENIASKNSASWQKRIKIFF